MTSKVFANGMEIASAGCNAKSIAALPDVCYTPPQAPPTPTGVPIPYPNTGMASDLTGGSTSVSILGEPICLKDKSSFKKTSGDEAGAAPLKGLITASNTGAVFFSAWSMDVKVEGENVVRHLDVGTHNHASETGNGPPWPVIATMSPSLPEKDQTCVLSTKEPESNCPKPKTGHHCIPHHCFKYLKGADGLPVMKKGKGLCVCVKGAVKASSEAQPKYESPRLRQDQFADNGKYDRGAHYEALAEHGRIHMIFDFFEEQLGKGKPPQTAMLDDLEVYAAVAIALVTGCDPQQIKKDLRAYHGEMGLEPKTTLHADPFGQKAQPDVSDLGTTIHVQAKPVIG